MRVCPLTAAEAEVGVEDRWGVRAGEGLGEVDVSDADTRPTGPVGGFLGMVDISSLPVAL